VSSESNFVNRFGTIIFALALFIAIFAVKLSAQPVPQDSAVTNASALVVPASVNETPAEPEVEMVPAAAPIVFTVLGLPITNSMICTWIVAALILIIVRSTTPKNIKEVPSGMQNLLESLVEVWDNLIGDVLDKRVSRWVFPFATTFFIFIVMSNLTDLVPGVGSIGIFHGTKFTPLFRPPTTDANLTIAMAGIFLVMSLFWAIRFNGPWGLVKHIFGVKMEANKWIYPLFLLLFIFIGAMELLSILFARPVALAMRLYGNVYAGESILDMIFNAPHLWESLLLSSFMYFYETFVCIVQAFVFAMLVVAFVGTLCIHEEEEHAH
jgi:F-type H+-transporting ATPase subunit a